MSVTRLEKITLGLSGVIAVGIAGSILIAPKPFYASYGIDVGDDPSLLSELRAPAAGSLVLGILMLIGIWRSALAQLAIAAALVVFVAFPAGRLIGLALDGVPSDGTLGALIVEIALLCIFAFRKRLLPTSRGLSDLIAKP